MELPRQMTNSGTSPWAGKCVKRRQALLRPLAPCSSNLSRTVVIDLKSIPVVTRKQRIVNREENQTRRQPPGLCGSIGF